MDVKTPSLNPQALRCRWPAVPPLDVTAAAVHAAWVRAKRASGVTSHLATDGEELMKPFERLSQQARQFDRDMVLAVYLCIGAQPSASARPTFDPLLAALLIEAEQVLQMVDRNNRVAEGERLKAWSGRYVAQEVRGLLRTLGATKARALAQTDVAAAATEPA